MTEKAIRKPTHLFLASLGKTRLRPGGKEATERILQACRLTADTKVLEVAPNMGTTAIQIAKEYGCQVTGIDIHQPSVERAQENIRQHGLEDRVQIAYGNALELPFAAETFDVVINEAMLSMLPLEQKKQAIAEYFRVLKPGGRLATHDLLLRKDPETPEVQERLAALRQLLAVNAQPMTEANWRGLFEQAAFRQVDCQTGKMSLLSLKGLLTDEGWEGTIQLLTNACKNPADQAHLFELIRTFDANDDLYGHITFTVVK
ncbi:MULTISPECIES: class I SAM-dependent methyltransferase [Brevibacillus]|jgi:Methylase involved in ubiquinone/menaquinone biosynthesis|uniref:class I SAM-dependent methyltransferase n=1 Tax=Brevibacillus TaxID=55080 RepID=UPI00156BB776|nr:MULTISPECIES: class I SAM-dependent methyltransferase [Brevibacillus]MDR5000487.1 class I SAM-dependent methyltransferase [Brevibacillus parabrevis]NRQ52861.1 class I SAM-dependent methyltransferase [Brevibacillus sp. HD1.4A]